MTPDARISTGLPDHPKTKKLIKRLGAGAGWYLVKLILWTAAHRSDGDLAGMTDEDIELAIDWSGENGLFARELASVGFLDGDEGSRVMHDWIEHNPWAAGSGQRAEKSRWAALCRRYGRDDAARQMPEYAGRNGFAPKIGGTGKKEDATGTDSSATGTDDIATGTTKPASGNDQIVPDSASGMPEPHLDSAPSPIPIPIPIPIPNPNTPQPPKGGERRARTDPTSEPEGFGAWYALYQRKDAKQDAMKAWRALAPNEAVQAAMCAALRRWQWNPTRAYNPLPATWIRDRRWEDEAVAGAPPPPADGSVPWFKVAGFANEPEANNWRCYAHNAHLFRDGRPVSDEVPT